MDDNRPDPRESQYPEGICPTCQLTLNGEGVCKECEALAKHTDLLMAEAKDL